MWWGITALVALGCSGASSSSSDSAAGRTVSGPEATGMLELVGTDVYGAPVDVSVFAGDDLVVWFWAPW